LLKVAELLLADLPFFRFAAFFHSQYILRMSHPVHVGLIGCGAISPVYMNNAKGFDSMRIVACADLQADRANARAAEYGIPRTCGVLELIHDPEVEVVLNLTTPDSHAEIAMASVHAGKCVYNEKPLTIRRRDARRILGVADNQGLLVGCAPDTFMGAGLQTCRAVIDEGQIGTPVAATAFMMYSGPEKWHPDPAFYFKRGGGPLFDMGPYYITALVSLLGRVARVSAAARKSFPTRMITSQPKHGESIEVEVPTHVSGSLEFASGALATLVMSFDVWHHSMPPLEIYGSEGSLQVPDPNGYGGPVRIRRHDQPEWKDVPLFSAARADNARGIGLDDLCRCLRCGQRGGRAGRPRAWGELAYHVLDVMHGLVDSAAEGRHVVIESGVERPEPV
jgi:predicted dehydrogenase